MGVEVVERLYDALSRRDGNAMADCYHPEARFSDPVFVDLRGDEIGAMWRMLCARGDDLEVTWGDVRADDEVGMATWEASYSFGPRRRPVHNRIESSFVFADGRILAHDDVFDFWRWTRMALGPVGTVAGWTPVIRRRVREQARAGLRRWIEAESSTEDG